MNTTDKLQVRTENDDVEIYEPFQTNQGDQDILDPSALRFIRRPSSYAGSIYNVGMEQPAQDADSDLPHPAMIAIGDLNGYHSVFLPGHKPSLVLKEPSSHPKILPLPFENVQSLSLWKSSISSDGFACVTSDASTPSLTIFRTSSANDSKRAILSVTRSHRPSALEISAGLQGDSMSARMSRTSPTTRPRTA